ncbi:MAG: LamG-like jellyroll fold domain-containing protein [Planctomycetota bacterium]
MKRRNGFTLIEILMVLALMAILLGVSAGALTRAVPANQLTTYQIRDAVRRARNFAIKEGSPAFVLLEASDEHDLGPTLTTGGQRAVGLWHFEDASLMGYPGPGLGAGFELVPVGVIGRGLQLVAEKPSYLDLGHASAFDATDGVACELFVKPYSPGARVLLDKGKSYSLTLDNELRPHAHVLLRTEGDVARDPGKRLEVELEEPLPLHRYTRLGMSFDGQTIELYVDGRLRNHGRLPARKAMLPDPGAALMIGKVQEPFAGEIDEVRLAVLVLEHAQRLPNVLRLGRPRTEIRFESSGKLDRLLHSGPVDIAFQSGDPPKQRALTVDLMGEIR